MSATTDYSRQSDPDQNRQFRRLWDGGCRTDPQPKSRRTAAVSTSDKALSTAILVDWRRTRKDAL